MTGNPRPPLDYTEARGALFKIAQQLRSLEDDLEEAEQAKADAEAEYHRVNTAAFLRRRAEDRGAGESELLAKGDAADAKRAWTFAEGRVKVVQAKLENRRGDRASTHRLAEWAKDLNVEATPLRRAA